MAKMRRYRRKPARKGKKAVIRKALRLNQNAKIRAVVKAVLGRQTETKVLQSAGALTVRTIQNLTSQSNFDQAVFMCTPQGATIGGISCQYGILGMGVGTDQRIGSEVKIKGHYINYIVNALPYSSVSNPTPKSQIVTVWVVQPKSGQRLGLTAANIQSSNAAIFYENEADSDSGMAGTLYDQLRKVDRDNWKVLAKRVHKIGWEGTLSTTNTVSGFNNNDFKQYAQGRIKIRGYNWKVDRLDNLQKLPIYMFVQVVAADGTLNGTSVIPVEFRFNQAVYYTDI